MADQVLEDISQKLDQAISAANDPDKSREQVMATLEIAIVACDKGKDHLNKIILEKIQQIKSLAAACYERANHE